MVHRRNGLAFSARFWARRAAAFLIAWVLVLAPAWAFDQCLGTTLELIIMSWLIVGLGVMITKDVELPFKHPQAVDVTGALRTLWWAMFWPRFLW